VPKLGLGTEKLVFHQLKTNTTSVASISVKSSSRLHKALSIAEVIDRVKGAKPNRRDWVCLWRYYSGADAAEYTLAGLESEEIIRMAIVSAYVKLVANGGEQMRPFVKQFVSLGINGRRVYRIRDYYKKIHSLK
jgi:hypothetical protein